MSAKAYTIYFDHTAEEVPCAVLGAGIVGLMTALELIKRGRKVTVYSEAIPDLEPKEKPKILSQIMPMIWMPKDYDWSEDMLKHELMSKLSFDFLKESVTLNRYQSLKEITILDAANDPDELKELITSYVGNLIKTTNIRHPNG